MKAFHCDVAMLRPLLHKLPLSSATGIDKIFAEHLSFAIFVFQYVPYAWFYSLQSLGNSDLTYF